MKKLFSISVLALAFVSCQNSSDRSLTDPVPSSQTVFTPPTAGKSDTIIKTPATNMGVSTQPTNNAAPVTSTAPAQTALPSSKTSANNSSSTALNPAHGAPGHRCDIAVGTPLNSPASITPITTTTTTATPSPVTAQKPALTPAKPTDKNVRYNPAHGAPGHDCAIPVGDPLKN